MQRRTKQSSLPFLPSLGRDSPPLDLAQIANELQRQPLRISNLSWSLASGEETICTNADKRLVYFVSPGFRVKTKSRFPQLDRPQAP